MGFKSISTNLCLSKGKEKKEQKCDRKRIRNNRKCNGKRDQDTSVQSGDPFLGRIHLYLEDVASKYSFVVQQGAEQAHRLIFSVCEIKVKLHWHGYSQVQNICTKFTMTVFFIVFTFVLHSLLDNTSGFIVSLQLWF